MKQGRAPTFIRDTPFWPGIHAYQILSKYLKGYLSYGVNKLSSTDGWMDTVNSEIFARVLFSRNFA